jgi:hypothetical protein
LRKILFAFGDCKQQIKGDIRIPFIVPTHLYLFVFHLPKICLAEVKLLSRKWQLFQTVTKQRVSPNILPLSVTTLYVMVVSLQSQQAARGHRQAVPGL